jgi:hypothetical protein
VVAGGTRICLMFALLGGCALPRAPESGSDGGPPSSLRHDGGDEDLASARDAAATDSAAPSDLARAKSDLAAPRDLAQPPDLAFTGTSTLEGPCANDSQCPQVVCAGILPLDGCCLPESGGARCEVVDIDGTCQTAATINFEYGSPNCFAF